MPWSFWLLTYTFREGCICSARLQSRGAQAKPSSDATVEGFSNLLLGMRDQDNQKLRLRRSRIG